MGVFDAFNAMTPTNSGIKLATRLGKDIVNEISSEPSYYDKTQYSLMFKDHQHVWMHRKDACGIYNCFGHVFASRRTAIFDESEIQKILIDDGFKRVVDPTLVMPDDLVLYFEVSGSICHAARVCKVETHMAGLIASKLSTPVIWAVSKWQNVTGEDMHRVEDFPDLKVRSITFGFWTDR